MAAQVVLAAVDGTLVPVSRVEQLPPGSVRRPTQTALAERFDISGLLENPTAPLAHQILILADAHHRGDIQNAVAIQRLLADYYQKQGDTAGATAAVHRARIGLALLTPPPIRPFQNSPPPPPPTPVPGQPPSGSDFSGSFYCMVNGTEHTWDFMKDGTYLHRTIAAGSGARAGVSERGTFALSADKSSMELRTTRTTVAYLAPTVGGRGTALGAGTDASSQVRVLSVNLEGPKNTHGTGIVLDGVAYNVRPW